MSEFAFEYVTCSDGIIRLEIPSYPTVIKENLYPAELDEEVYYPEEGRMRKLLYRYYHPDSFRRVPIMKRRDEEVVKEYGLLIACPIDKWDERTGRCGVATRALQIWHPYEKLDELLWRCHLPPRNKESLAYKRRSHTKNILKDIDRIRKLVPAVAGFGEVRIRDGIITTDIVVMSDERFDAALDIIEDYLKREGMIPHDAEINLDMVVYDKTRIIDPEEELMEWKGSIVFVVFDKMGIIDYGAAEIYGEYYEGEEELTITYIVIK